MSRVFALVAIVASLSTASAGAARGDDGWRTVHDKGGVTLERRPVDGSRYYEYRVRAHTTVAPAIAVERIWSGIGDERSPTIKHRTVVQRADDELVVYDQIHAAVVSDRDVTIRIRRSGDAERGFDIAFESTAELGPPPSSPIATSPFASAARATPRAASTSPSSRPPSSARRRRPATCA
ncbi:MAG TPA: hypothetical protein VGL86_00085 [Polyangia bacterium]